MSDSTHDPDSRNTWTQPRFVIAAVVVALIAVMAVVLAITGPSGGDSTGAPTPTDSATQSSTTEAPSTSDSACGLEPADQAVPVAPPPDTEWELVGTVAAPTAPETIGPGVVDDGLRSCFARAPSGALFAAANVIATTTAPDLVVPLIRELAAEGPGREAALEALEVDPPTATDPGALQIAGFSFLNYDNDLTVVDLVLRARNGGYGHVPLTMRWEDGDWKVVLPQDGNIAGTLQDLPDLAGYVPWGGA